MHSKTPNFIIPWVLGNILCTSSNEVYCDISKCLTRKMIKLFAHILIMGKYVETFIGS